jgi:hypothetical protein
MPQHGFCKGRITLFIELMMRLKTGFTDYVFALETPLAHF